MGNEQGSMIRFDNEVHQVSMQNFSKRKTSLPVIAGVNKRSLSMLIDQPLKLEPFKSRNSRTLNNSELDIMIKSPHTGTITPSNIV